MGRLDQLATELRAAVVAGVLACGDRAADLLARVSPDARAAAEDLLALDRGDRAAALARAVAAMVKPVPAGLTLVHRDWIEAAIAGEDADVRDAVAGAGEFTAAARVWLQRRALGQLVDMPPADAAPPAAWARCDVAVLLAALAAFGVDAIAAGLVGAPPATAAAVAARLGEPRGSHLVDAVAAWKPRERELRAAVSAFAHGAGRLSERALHVIGARRLGAALARAHGDAPRQIAQRLPRAVGLELAAASNRYAAIDGELDRFARLVDGAAGG